MIEKWLLSWLEYTRYLASRGFSLLAPLWREGCAHKERLAGARAL